MKVLTYENGLKDAWKLAGQIRLLDAKDLDFIMNQCEVSTLTELYIDVSPKKIIEAMELLKNKKQVKVGDVIYIEGDNKKFYLCTKDNVEGNYKMCQILASDGTAYACQKRNCIKINKKIEIDNLLRYLK